MIYFDMDGVLAKWGNVSLEDTYKPGYFANRPTETKAAKLIRLLEEKGHEVVILTAAYCEGHARADKMHWLEDNGLGDVPAMMIPYGEDKAACVRPHPDNILVDDFTQNLREWEAAGYTGVKFYNGINGTHGTWDGFSVNDKMTPEKMAVVIDGIAKSLKAA